MKKFSRNRFSRGIRFAERLWRIGFRETLIGASLAIFFVLLAIAFAWVWLKGWSDIGDIQVEFWGLIFDVAVILVGFGLIQHRKQKRDDIARHTEVIEDLKRWDSEEAKHRVLGAMRRSNRLGKTDFELSGAQIKNVNFNGYGIDSISGSTLSSGGIWRGAELSHSKFEGIDFSELDAREVVFENAVPLRFGKNFLGHGLRAIYKDCDFCNAKLDGATFNGAELIWTNEPPENLEEVIYEEPDGRPHYQKAARGCFEDVDLSTVSFKDCTLKWADFREAMNVEDAVFTGAEGLETCFFDNEGLKKSIIQKSKEKPSSTK